MTGSSRGIGRAIAHRLARDGWKVAVHYSTSRNFADELTNTLGKQVSGIYQADLANPDSTEELIHQVLNDGDLDALVNNAGIYNPGEFLAGTRESFLEDYRKMMAVNLESPVRLMREASRYFVARGQGSIVNVASRVGFRGEAGASIYAASKAGLINFVRSLAVELAPKNIGIFGIAPGWVETAMARDGFAHRIPDVLAGIPLGRMATPEDCAATTAFLLSDDAKYLSGITIDINGASYFH